MTLAPPLTDAIQIAVAQLFADDAVNRRDPDARPRDPSHQALTECIQRAGFQSADVRTGKEKRIRATLSWALDHDLENGRRLVGLLVATSKGCGGFREDSPNYVGIETITNLRSTFQSEGWLLTSDGGLEPTLVGEDLVGPNVTEVLASYARRAVRGSDDDALVIGTSKDLVEATAAHVLVETLGSYDPKHSFEAVLGRAYLAVGLAVPGDGESASEPARKKLERAMFTATLGVNTLRNKAGVGHGRPFLPEVGPVESRIAVRVMGSVAELLLDALRKPRS